MSYGMTYEQFWYGDPNMTIAYREAYTLQRRKENEDMWLQGMYIYSALQAVIGTAFGKRQIKYEQKPFDLFPKTKLEVEQEKAQERQKLINFLNKLMG
jgi:hypothetical protein